MVTYTIIGGTAFASIIIGVSLIAGACLAFIQVLKIRAIVIRVHKVEHHSTGEETGLVFEANGDHADNLEDNTDLESRTNAIKEIYSAIMLGAKSFLWAEYKVCGMF